MNWEKKTLIIQRQLKRKFKVGDYFVSPKTRSGRRTIVLGIRTLKVLHEHLKRQDEAKRAGAHRWTDNDLVFPSTIGTPINHSNLYRSFKKLLRLSGLPEIRFHDLRHTAASLMLNHGVPSIIVSRRLGHSKVSTTLDIYGHLIPEMQNEAAELIDDLIFPIEVELHTNCTRKDKSSNKYPHHWNKKGPTEK